MKVLSRTVVLAVFAVLSLITCKSFAQGSVTDVTLEGTIGKYPIVMELQVWEGGPNILGGNYYYKSQGPKNKIGVSSDLNIVEGNGYQPRLEETVKGKVTGVFYVSKWNMKTMSGTWIRTSDHKQFSFTLKVVKTYRHYYD